MVVSVIKVLGAFFGLLGHLKGEGKTNQFQGFNDLDILHSLTLSCHSLTPGTFGVLIPDL